MTERVCQHCRYWVSSNDFKGRLGNCHRWIGGDGGGGYGWSADEIPDDGVVVETDEGWGAYTGKKFGCVLFKDKS